MKSHVRLLKLIPVIVLLLVGLTGCGLSDYERRMEEQRKRVKEFDETNKMLDDPLEMPMLQIQSAAAKTDPKTEAKAEVKVEPGWPYEPFLRLPKGFGNTVSDKYKAPYNYPFPFFRYVGSDTTYNFFVVAALVAESEKVEKFREYTPKNFRTYVQQAIEDFLLKTYNSRFLQNKSKVEKIGIKEFTPLTQLPEDQDKQIGYDRITYSGMKNPVDKEPMVFFAYFHEEAPRQICIVVNAPVKLVATDAFKKSLEASLGTLDVTFDAVARRAQYNKAKRP